MIIKAKNTTTEPSGNSSWMTSGSTRYYIDGLDVSGTNFNLFYAGLQNSGYENLESVNTGGFSASSGNTVPGNVAASAKYIYFNSRIRTNFVRAITRLNQGFSCRFYETEDNMYFLQWGERSGIGTFSGRQNDLSNGEALLVSSLIQKYYEGGYYNTSSGQGPISMNESHNRIGFVPLDVDLDGGTYAAYQSANYRCNIYIRGNQNQITVSATSSNTPVADGQVVFGARASLVVNGNIAQTKNLENGRAEFNLPSSQNISLSVYGGWTVRYDYGGAAVPVFHPLFWPFNLNFEDDFKIR